MEQALWNHTWLMLEWLVPHKMTCEILWLCGAESRTVMMDSETNAPPKFQRTGKHPEGILQFTLAVWKEPSTACSFSVCSEDSEIGHLLILGCGEVNGRPSASEVLQWLHPACREPWKRQEESWNVSYAALGLTSSVEVYFMSSKQLHWALAI